MMQAAVRKEINEKRFMAVRMRLGLARRAASDLASDPSMEGLIAR